MQQAKIKTQQGETLLNIPEHCTEISLSQAVAFSIKYERYRKLLFDEAPTIEIIKSTVACLVAFFDVPESDFMLNQLESQTKTVKSNYETTILGLFQYVVSAMSTYEPEIYEQGEACKFEHNGQSFVIPGYIRDKGNLTLNVAQTVELLEAERLIGQMLSEKDISDESKGNIEFSKLVRVLGVLCKKESETFPWQQSEIESFVTARMEELRSVNMKIGYDVYFFLTNTKRS